MQLRGLLVIHIDVDAEVAADYHRWYDLDHGPEVVGLPGVATTRRYRASPRLRELRTATDWSPFGPDEGELLSLYWLVDEDLAGTRKRITDYLGPEGPIAAAGRLFRRDRVRIRSAEVFRRAAICGSPDLETSVEALPYIGHTGVYVEIWESDGSASEAERADWLADVHAPELAACPEVLSVLELASGPETGVDALVSVALLDGDVEAAAAGLHSARAGAPREAPGLRRRFGGCFELISPLRYEFTATV